MRYNSRDTAKGNGVALSNIRQDYDAQVKEAMARTSAAYKKGRYAEALEILEPFRGNKRVDFAIEKIETILQASEKPKREPLTKEQKRIFYGLVFLAMCMFVFFGILSTPQPPAEVNSPIENTSNFESDYYTAFDGVLVRTCQNFGCESLVELPVGTRVSFIAAVEGEASPTDGTTLWYHVRLSDEREGFINSRLLSEIRPTPVPTQIPPPVSRPSNNSGSSSGGNTSQRPDNCDEAVAMGLTAQQAAQWSHLDRDRDGVACYGD